MIVTYQHQNKSVLTLTLDLSLGGMKIKTESPLPKDQCLRFKIVLGVNSFSLKGRIAYSRFTPDEKTVSGIHFLELSRKQRQSLQDYLSSVEEYGFGLPLSVARS